MIDDWAAPNLRGNAGDGLGNWSKDDIVATLKTARNAQRAVIGQEMGDVVVHSTQHLSDADLRAIASYLKTLAPSAGAQSKFAADPDHRERAGRRPRSGSRRRVVRRQLRGVSPHRWRGKPPSAAGDRGQFLGAVRKSEFARFAWCSQAARCREPRRLPRP